MIRVELKLSDDSPLRGINYYFVILRGMPGDSYLPLGSARPLPVALRLKAKAEAALRAFSYNMGAETEDKAPTAWDRLISED